MIDQKIDQTFSPFHPIFNNRKNTDLNIEEIPNLGKV